MLTESDLNQIKGLLHYLNTNMTSRGGELVVADFGLIDSNGEEPCHIGWDVGADAYVLKVPE